MKQTAVVNPWTYQTESHEDHKEQEDYPQYQLVRTIVDANVEAEDINSFDEFKRNVFAVIDKLTSEMNRRFSDVTRRQLIRSHPRQKTF